MGVIDLIFLVFVICVCIVGILLLGWYRYKFSVYTKMVLLLSDMGIMYYCGIGIYNGLMVYNLLFW